MKFFAYTDLQGHIHVKNADGEFGKEKWGDAMESDLVDSVTNLYDAETREQAEELAKQKLGDAQ